MKEKIYRAGMILYHIGEELEMLFMVPSDGKYGGNDPQIPKGKIEEDEDPIDAAIREAREEVGLFAPNIDGHVHKLGQFLGRTTIFIAKIKDKEKFGDPHYETESTVWMTPDQFYEDGRTLHGPIVKAAVRTIEELENVS